MPAAKLPEYAQSKYQSWLQELEALHELRKSASIAYVEMREDPKKAIIFVDILNEMYRIIRPLLEPFERDGTKKGLGYDAKIMNLYEDVEKFMNELRAFKQIDPYGFKPVPNELQRKMDTLYHEIYQLRHDHGLGFKTMDKFTTGKVALERSTQI